MTPAIPRRRSVYADRLREFEGIALGDDDAFRHRRRWGDFFRQRIGPSFDGRLTFEIGCSEAAYLARIAAAHPATAFVGLDWKCKSLYDGAKRVAAAGLANVVLLRGRGQDVGRIFGAGEVDETWLFHPDPCDRNVERPNRLFSEPFLLDLHPVLRDRTSILALKTDHAEYYQSALGHFGLAGSAAPSSAMDRIDTIRQRFVVTMKSSDFWRDPSALAHTASRFFAGEVTAYERRFVEKRRPIYYVEFCKMVAGSLCSAHFAPGTG